MLQTQDTACTQCIVRVHALQIDADIMQEAHRSKVGGTVAAASQSAQTVPQSSPPRGGPGSRVSLFCACSYENTRFVIAVKAAK